jgi:hypothetical protein
LNKLLDETNKLEMKKMKNQMIPLTVANSLDQSTKQKIETRGQQTVKQAIQNAKMAPQGQFDIFDDLGQVISNQQVDQFRDKTIYIGVQKVAGGAIQIDDDWDIGIDLDDIDKPVRKVVTFKDWGGTRFEVEPQGEERLIQAAERAGIRPRGGDRIEVRDGEDNDVSALRARDMIGRVFQVNPRTVPAGAGGIPLNRLDELRIEYPSIQPVKQHMNSSHTDMIILRFPSGERTSSGFWHVAIHCPDACKGSPHAFVLNFDKIVSSRAPIISGNAIRGVHQNDGVGTRHTTIPGTNKPAHWVCHGGILNVLNHLGNDPITRIGAYVNHIQNLLNA